MSGPVVLPKLYNGRNRTFWTASYEGLYRTLVTLGNPITMRTLGERNGDLSALLPQGSVYQIYDSATSAAARSSRFSRGPFPGNITPTARLDKTALGLLQYFPLPNLTGLANGTNNFQTRSSDINRQVSLVSKVDHNFSDRHREFFRWNHDSQLFISNGITDDNKTNVSDRWRRSQAGVFDDVFVISPSLVNDFRVGFTRFDQASTPEVQGFDLAKPGFAPALTTEVEPRARQLPTLSIAGYQSFGGAANNDDATNYFTTSNDLSWSKGAAIFRFGGELRIYRDDLYNWLPENPTLTFNSKWTNGPLDSAASAPIGQGLASFLLGVPSAGSASLNDSFADHSYNYALCLQTELGM